MGGRLEDALRRAMRLYLVTDSRWLCGRSLENVVDEAIDGGVTFVQLREKGASTDELVRIGAPLLELCRRRGVPFVVNDDVLAARLLGADGVHVGQSDADCAHAREAMGPDAIVGVSVQTAEQAHAAREAGASYLGVGAMLSTRTKRDAHVVSRGALRDICECAGLPVVAIGGIDSGNALELSGLGIDGVAVVSAIMAAPDLRAAAEEMLHASSEAIGICEEGL